MRAITSSMDVHGVRYTEKRKRLERIKRANEIEEKEKATSAGYYESRGMTKEDKERERTMTPQEAFRREVAEMTKSPVYAKLQKQEIKEKEKEEKEETKAPEETEVDQEK